MVISDQKWLEHKRGKEGVEKFVRESQEWGSSRAIGELTCLDALEYGVMYIREDGAPIHWVADDR